MGKDMWQSKGDCARITQLEFCNSKHFKVFNGMEINNISIQISSSVSACFGKLAWLDRCHIFN